MFLMLSHLFIAALWSLAGKKLTTWLLLVMFIVFLLLSHVVSFPDLCCLSYIKLMGHYMLLIKKENFDFL